MCETHQSALDKRSGILSKPIVRKHEPGSGTFLAQYYDGEWLCGDPHIDLFDTRDAIKISKLNKWVKAILIDPYRWNSFPGWCGKISLNNRIWFFYLWCSSQRTRDPWERQCSPKSATGVTFEFSNCTILTDTRGRYFLNLAFILLYYYWLKSKRYFIEVISVYWW